MRPHPDGHCTCATHIDRAWNRPEHWKAAEVDYLEQWYGRRTDESIARHLGRTVVGVRLKARRLGIRKRGQGMSGRDVAAIFGVDDGTVGKVWVRRGLMAAGYGAFRQGPHRMLLIDGLAVERFIRDHPEWVDVDKMPDSPYRDLAARDPWVSLPEAHRRTGRAPHTIARLIRAGLVEGRRRGVHWYLPVRELARVGMRSPEAIEDARFRRESTLAMQRARRKGLVA